MRNGKEKLFSSLGMRDEEVQRWLKSKIQGTLGDLKNLHDNKTIILRPKVTVIYSMSIVNYHIIKIPNTLL